MSKNLVFQLLLFSIMILVPYLFVIHPFEIPDEQSHYATVNFLVQEGRMPTMKDPQNLSKEEHLVEQVFGIMSQGQNKYSFHPEYRMEYVSGLIGKYEQEIEGYDTKKNRSTYTIHQSALYPPLYYYFSSLFYSVVGSMGIITRIFTIRFASLVITIFIPAIAYFMGKRIWQDELSSRILAFMAISFPMTTYLGVGINSDNLHNLLFGVAILLALDLIKHGWAQKRSLAISTVIGLDLITKPQAYILLPIFILAVIIRWHWREWKVWFANLPFLLIPLILIAGYQELPKFFLGNETIGATSYLARVVEYGGAENFKQFLHGYINTHTKEMVVWYWGVFKWFGVVMPRPFWWIADRLVILSSLGIISKLGKDISKHKFSWDSKVIIFSILANLVYAMALFWFDWQFYQEFGRSLGLQARYYMPLLVTQMYLFYAGLTELGWNKKIKTYIGSLIIIFFLALQLGSLYTQLNAYYDLWPLPRLVEEISQYKPFFAKGSWWYLWGSMYIFGILGYLRLVFQKSTKLSTL